MRRDGTIDTSVGDRVESDVEILVCATCGRTVEVWLRGHSVLVEGRADCQGQFGPHVRAQEKDLGAEQSSACGGESTVHEVKCWPPFFFEVVTGKKTFELRKDDRGFKVGDELLLNEWDSGRGYTGRSCERTISYLLRDAEGLGLAEGYVILGLTSTTRDFGAPPDPSAAVPATQEGHGDA